MLPTRPCNLIGSARNMAVALALGVLLTAGASAQTTIYTESTDQSLKLSRADGTTVGTNGPSELSLPVGKSGSGAGFDRAAVVVFQLPDLGAVPNPFLTAAFQVYHEEANETVDGTVNGDLYGLGRRATSAVELDDYYGRTDVPDPTDATRLQDNFLVNGQTPSSAIVTSASGSANLLAYLNAQYAEGAGIGQYVFLRINTDNDTTGRWNIESSDGAADLTQTAQITYTLAPPPVDTIQVETADDGSGTPIPAQTLTAGDFLTAFSIARDGSDAFLSNTPVTWLLGNITGDIVAEDLEPAVDGMSATFYATGVGTAEITIIGSASNLVGSGTITVVAGPASDVFVETMADGSGTAVVAQNLLTGEDTLTAYSIARDFLGNFIENSASTWSLENVTGDVVAGDLVPAGDGKSAVFTASGLGSANIRATSGVLFPVDSGLITVISSDSLWVGGGANSSWSSAGQWDVDPAYDSSSDLFFYQTGVTRFNTYIAANRRARSINYTADADTNFNIRYTQTGTANARNITLDTNSLTEPAEINIDADATGSFKLGNIGTAGPYGSTVLADNLLVTHNGSGNLIMDADITETGGARSLTKAGPGTLVISGTNSYTGDSIVKAGILALDGGSIADTNTLVIDGGVVRLDGDETVTSLFLGTTEKSPGIYGSSSSSAPLANQDDTRFAGSSTLIVTSGPNPAGFSTWITGSFANGTVPLEQQGPNDDPDGDGIDNLMEYAIEGLDPTVANGSAGTLTGLTLSFSKRQPPAVDIAYAIEQSTDLGIADPWETVAATEDSTSISYTLPGGLPKDFIRLMVTQLP